jgi:hypothetical protein
VKAGALLAVSQTENILFTFSCGKSKKQGAE